MMALFDVAALVRLARLPPDQPVAPQKRPYRCEKGRPWSCSVRTWPSPNRPGSKPGSRSRCARTSPQTASDARTPASASRWSASNCPIASASRFSGPLGRIVLARALKCLAGHHAIIVDDIGYVQQNREEMEVLFALLASRRAGAAARVPARGSGEHEEPGADQRRRLPDRLERCARRLAPCAVGYGMTGNVGDPFT
jgi:hypothetical protein